MQTKWNNRYKEELDTRMKWRVSVRRWASSSNNEETHDAGGHIISPLLS